LKNTVTGKSEGILKAIGVIGLLLGLVALIAGLYVFGGWLICLIWNLFIAAPLGLAQIPLLVGVGIMLLLSIVASFFRKS
jgi:hypothetical protein